MKKGFFFSMDAFFAIMIFTMVLVSVYGYFVSTNELRQQYYFSEDLLDLFTKIKMSEMNEVDTHPDLSRLKQWDLINDDLTVTDQVIYLKNKGYSNYSEWIVNNLTSGLLSERYGLSFDIQGLIYERENEVNALVSRQRFVSG